MTRTPSRIGAATISAAPAAVSAELTPVQRLEAILSMRLRLGIVATALRCTELAMCMAPRLDCRKDGRACVNAPSFRRGADGRVRRQFRVHDGSRSRRRRGARCATSARAPAASMASMSTF